MNQPTTDHNLRLYKREKLCSLTAIDALFARRGGKGALAYPLRAVWSPRPEGYRMQHGAPVQFLISVPKKRLRHAVDRVTMRRRIREAYRLQRHLLPPELADAPVDVAFIYVADTPLPYHKVQRAIARLLPLIGQ